MQNIHSWQNRIDPPAPLARFELLVLGAAKDHKTLAHSWGPNLGSATRGASKPIHIGRIFEEFIE